MEYDGFSDISKLINIFKLYLSMYRILIRLPTIRNLLTYLIQPTKKNNSILEVKMLKIETNL